MMLRIKNPIILQLTLQKAAESAFETEIIQTGMECLTVGQGKEFESKQDWVLQRIDDWMISIQEKFKLFQQQEDVEIDQQSIINAEAFYRTKLGNSMKIKIGTHNSEVIRVPGGWIFQLGNLNPTFIPYSNEFEFVVHPDGENE